MDPVALVLITVGLVIASILFFAGCIITYQQEKQRQRNSAFYKELHRARQERAEAMKCMGRVPR